MRKFSIGWCNAVNKIPTNKIFLFNCWINFNIQEGDLE